MRSTKRVRRRAPTPDPTSSTPKNDELQRRIDTLIERAWEGLERLVDECKPAEVIRLLEFLTKLSSSRDVEGEFWTMIDELRREEMGNRNPSKAPTESEVSCDDAS